MKKIKPGEAFALGDKVFTYRVDESGNVIIKPIDKKVAASKKEFVPPTLEEVQDFFKSNGYASDLGKDFHKYYENGNPPWTDGKGQAVKSWKQKALSVWMKPERKEIKEEKSTFKFFQ